jgi:hypothetical protein
MPTWGAKRVPGGASPNVVNLLAKEEADWSLFLLDWSADGMASVSSAASFFPANTSAIEG